MILNFFQKAQGELWPKVYENLVKNAFFFTDKISVVTLQCTSVVTL